jgi:phosphoribosylamine--glycine ligase
VEFNARFGDPETQPLLALLESPLGQLLRAAATGRLDEVEPLRWRNAAAVTVVMAAAGYPASPRKGDVISGVAEAEERGAAVLHAGTTSGPEGLAVSGGRVLGVTATGETLAEARDVAYAGVEVISFDGVQYRHDIAQQAAASSATA